VSRRRRDERMRRRGPAAARTQRATLRCTDVRLSLSTRVGKLNSRRQCRAGASCCQRTAHQTTQAGLPSVLSATARSHPGPNSRLTMPASTDGSTTTKDVNARHLGFQFTASTRRRHPTRLDYCNRRRVITSYSNLHDVMTTS